MTSSVVRRVRTATSLLLAACALTGVLQAASIEPVRVWQPRPLFAAMTDELADWSKVDGHSTGWSFDSSNPSSFDGDTNRIKRTSNTNQSIRYYQATGFTGASVKVYYFGSITNKFRLFRSADATNWTQVSVTNTTGVATSGGWYRTTFTPSVSLPSGATYLMVELYNDSNSWAPQIAQVVLSYNDPLDGGFTENLDGASALFHKADGWTNGGHFNCGWRADHVTFSGGLMSLTVDNIPCPSGCSSKPYAAGEYRSNDFYGYGRYEVRMKPAKYSGAVTGSFFTYTGPSNGDPHDEIDIEFLGNDLTILQTNYFTNGTGGHESIVDLGFDASLAFHTYAFEWTPTSIKWFVDDDPVPVVIEDGSRGTLPTHPGRIELNVWPGTGVDGWLGPFNYTGPFQAQYDWVRFTPIP